MASSSGLWPKKGTRRRLTTCVRAPAAEADRLDASGAQRDEPRQPCNHHTWCFSDILLGQLK